MPTPRRRKRAREADEPAPVLRPKTAAQRAAAQPIAPKMPKGKSEPVDAIERLIEAAKKNLIEVERKEEQDRRDLQQGLSPFQESAPPPPPGAGEGEVALQLSPQEIARQAEETRRFLLASMGHLASAVEELKSGLDRDVENARLLGVTWADIARAVGVTPQSAYRRWDPDGKRKDRDYRRKIRGSATEPGPLTDD